jgi:methanethiol S-methyltransferase
MTMAITLLTSATHPPPVTSNRLIQAIQPVGTAVAWAALVSTLLYAVGFLGTFTVPKSVDLGGGGWPARVAFIIDLELLALLGLQLSGAARGAFHRCFSSPPLASSLYVLCCGLVLALALAAWQPLSAVIWRVGSPEAVRLLQSLSLFGWLAAAYAAYIGRRVDLSRWLALEVAGRFHPALKELTRLHRLLRRLPYAGVVLACWSTPIMTVGHLLIAASATAYACLLVWLDERKQFAASS